MKNRLRSSRPQQQRTVILDLLEADVIEAIKALPKIVKSPALNGGFDRLVERVEKIDTVLNSREARFDVIDQKNDQISQKLDLIHDAIYEPDDGLYARIRDVESARSKINIIDEIEKDVLLLKEREKIDIESDEAAEKLAQRGSDLLYEHDKNLQELLEFKKKIVTFSRWFGGFLLTSFLAGSGKLLYELISKHVVIH